MSRYTQCSRSFRALAFAAVAVVACALSSTSLQAQDLTGAGSTFIAPIMTRWIAEYKKETGVSINYQSVGSGAGINNLIDGTIDFAGSDAPMNSDELGRAKGPVTHLPVVVGAVVVAYNIDGQASGLALTGQDIADIFLGKIKYWDDARITRANSNRTLPHEPIFIVHRSDGSGTTAIFTDYLSKVSPEWQAQVGAGKSVKWPSGLGGKGNAGVAEIVKQHNYSIGYVELAYAVENKISYAQLKTGNSYYSATIGTAKQAAYASKLPDNLCGMITNAPQGYPITGMTWLIVYSTNPKSAQIKKFFKWILTKGQKFTGELYYAAIPDNVVKREMKLIDQLK